jgi:hypothetical protein
VGLRSSIINDLYRHTRFVRTRRGAALVFAVLAGVGGGSVATAGPAAAAVPGLSAVSVSGTPSTDPRQSVTVTCPGNTVLISAAGYLTGAVGAATVDDIFPDPAARSVTVTGSVTDPPFAGSWSPTAVAYCSDPLPGLVWVEEQSAYNSVDKSVTATCPVGKKLVGNGASVHNGYGEVLLTGIVPKNGGAGVAADSVTVVASEEAPYASPWLVVAYAACANQLLGQEVSFGASAHDSTDPKAGITATCQGSKVATGGGAALIVSPGGIGNVVLDDLYPNNLNTGSAPTMTIASAYGEDTPVGASWTLKLFALCADP